VITHTWHARQAIITDKQFQMPRQRAAEDENRPLSNWIETTLKRALAERDDTS
jgi:hypothetical protein